MKILALDTATDACSAALFIDGAITEEFVIAQQQHSQIILPMLDKLLSAAELKLNAIDAFAFGRGPGSFTGLRIAASVIQALAFAHNRPVIPVSTLQAMAKTAYRKSGSQHILACLDARMHEIYYAAFVVNADCTLIAVTEETVCSPEKIKLPNGNFNWHGVGNGWTAYAEELPTVSKIMPDIYPCAWDIALLAANDYRKNNVVGAEKAIPVYLRNNVVT
jgi:tRNA threonylcarbamoyladenosine biosynthesis protein TsaB